MKKEDSVDKYRFHHPNDDPFPLTERPMEYAPPQGKSGEKSKKKKKKKKKKDKSSLFDSLMRGLEEIKADRMIDERNKMILELCGELKHCLDYSDLINRAEDLASKDFGLKKTIVYREVEDDTEKRS